MLRMVTTNYGTVKGLPAADPRITSFKGIPFAAPPVGENRWRAPQKCPKWEGIKEAYAFAPISVQDQPAVGDDIYCREWHVDPDVPMSEDCLYLNVWTPAKKADEKLPVLVWYFGGGFQWGYPSEMEFDGERIARRGIVVVSVNYRLNVFGFLSHPEITKESPDAPSNFAFLDQQAGTRWVKENIEFFGGDPDNITIAGQSAGGGSVMAQLTNLENKGLFKRAVVLSGMIQSPYRDGGIPAPASLKEQEKWGEEFFKFLGVTSLAEARKIDKDTLLAKYNEFVKDHPRLFGTEDGKFVKGDSVKKCIIGDCLDIPIMAGNTADEFLNFITAADDEELSKKAHELFGADADIFLKMPEVRKHSENDKYGIVSGIELTVKTVFERRKEFGSSNNFYYYRFNPDIPGEDDPGTFHSCDLWFFFETLAKCSRPYVGRHYDLARMMCNYWCNFIKTGDPNGKDADGKDMPYWSPYTKEDNFEMEFTPFGPIPKKEEEHEFKKFLREALLSYKLNGSPRKQAFNPYLPSWEYVPDGEPYVFGNRVYVYGSHDHYNGEVFCMGDYVGWSAPVDDLGNWRYEGVIFRKEDEPLNTDGSGMLYAPDMTVGPDGRYYLYYAISSRSNISVAVCDTPAGKFEFYGHVHYKDGTRLGEREGDEHQFDPGVITEGKKTYLYTGFCGWGDKSRHGAMCTVLDEDMLTVIEDPKFVVPGCEYSEGTGFEGHEYFEAASIRKIRDKYVFVYSSIVMHELCYAVSDKPDEGFKFGGVLISNSDLTIDSYKPANMATAFGANNHGSIIKIRDKWYVFYHRHTNGTWYSRQVCAEKLEVDEDKAQIKQAELTSCGLNDGPLKAEGYYPSYIACNLFNPDDEETFRKRNDIKEPDVKKIKIIQDADESDGYVTNIMNNDYIGFKYFDFQNVKKISVWMRGYASGTLEIRNDWDKETVGSVAFTSDNIWKKVTADVNIPNGKAALYLTFKGTGKASLRGIEFGD